MNTLSLMCTVCNAPSNRRCEICQDVAYCSSECQQADWLVHRYLCEKFARLSPPPSATHRLCVHLPAIGVPEVVWVDCRNKTASDGKTIHILAGFFEEHRGARIVSIHFRTNWVRRRHIYPGLGMFYQQNRQGSTLNLPQNACIRALDQEQHLECDRRNWRGSVIVMVIDKREDDQVMVEDLTMKYYRDMIDCLCFQVDQNPPILAEVPYKVACKVKGVRISCLADRRALEITKYTTVDVPLDHPVLANPPTPATVFVNLPLAMYRYPVTTDQVTDPNQYTNEDATVLHMVTNTYLPSWGMFPRWNTHLGSVLVVRTAKRDLDREHVEGLVHYLWNEVAPRVRKARMGDANMTRARSGRASTEDGSMGGAGMGGGSLMERDAVMASVNEDDFKTYWGKLVDDRSMVQWNWMDVRSPFG